MKNLIALSLTALLLTACGGDNSNGHSDGSDPSYGNQTIMTNPEPVIASSSDAIAIAKAEVTRDIQGEGSLFNKDINRYDAVAVSNVNNELMLYDVGFYHNSEPKGHVIIPAYEGYSVTGSMFYEGQSIYRALENYGKQLPTTLIESRGGKILERRVIANANEILGIGIKTDINLNDLVEKSGTPEVRDLLDEANIYYVEPYYIFTGAMLEYFGDLRGENVQYLAEAKWLMPERAQRAQMLAAGRE